MKGYTFVGFITKGSREQMPASIRPRFPLGMAVSNEKPYPTAAEALSQAKKRRLRDITVHETDDDPPALPPAGETFTKSGL